MTADIDFKRLAPDEFEELCFDILVAHDFSKLSWRRGGGDSGRDIQGVRSVVVGVVEPFDERWFFECKRYEKGVPPEELNSKIAWADAEQPQHLVFFISSYLTNPCRDWIEKIRTTKSYRIHVLEGKHLQLLVTRFPSIASRYFASDIQRLMQDAHRAWLFHNLVPEPGALRRLAAKDRVDQFEICQLAFLWASLKIRAIEVRKDMDDSYPESYEHIFGILAQHSTTTQSVLAGVSEWDVIQLVDELIPYEPIYPKTFAVQVAHIVGKVDTISLYCFVRDSDGEGLEVLVDQDSNLSFSIRHLSSGATDALAEAKKILRML